MCIELYFIAEKYRDLPKMKKLLFICHSIYLRPGKVFDPNCAITFGFLEYYFKRHYSVIRHSLYKSGEARVYSDGINCSYKKIGLIGTLPDIIRYGAEIFFNIFYLILHKPREVIAIDPLSCFAPALLRKIGWLKRCFLITPDFTRQRFNNKLLNRIYFLVDEFCTSNANINFCCSKIVIDYKRKLYRNRDFAEKFFHLPNIPNPWIVGNVRKDLSKVKNRVIYVGNISSQINFIEFFDVIVELGKKYRDIHLILVGEGNQKGRLKNYITESNITNIRFLGQLPYTDTLKEISRAEIGLALYNNVFSYDEFRDSCKIREYQALSTVPIASSVVKANAQEILQYQSGILVNSDTDIFNQIDKLLSDEGYKREMQRNAYQNYLIYADKYNDFYDLIRK